jgi:hypothetical protein
MSSSLGIFNQKLVNFFEDLVDTFPEERDIKLGLEAIQGAKKINPKLLLDMFYEYVAKPLKDAILAENEQIVIAFARAAISTQFNEISPALMIFDKHWHNMSEGNHKAIWNHLKVLVLLSEKARA